MIETSKPTSSGAASLSCASVVSKEETSMATTRPALQYDPVAAVLSRATEVIGDPEEAFRWMGKPIRALGYATPISLAATPQGRESVLTVLDRLEHGVL